MQLTPRLISSTHTHAVALTHSHTHTWAQSYNNSLQFKLITWCTWGYDLAFSIAIKPATGERGISGQNLSQNLIISEPARKAAPQVECVSNHNGQGRQ